MKFIRTSDNRLNQKTKDYLEYKQGSTLDEGFIRVEESTNELNKAINNLSNKKIDLKDMPIKELFIDFYLKNRGVQPKDELTNLFLEIISEEGETKDETD